MTNEARIETLMKAFNDFQELGRIKEKRITDEERIESLIRTLHELANQDGCERHVDAALARNGLRYPDILRGLVSLEVLKVKLEATHEA